MIWLPIDKSVGYFRQVPRGTPRIHVGLIRSADFQNYRGWPGISIFVMDMPGRAKTFVAVVDRPVKLIE
jgi:hypothetical protein